MKLKTKFQDEDFDLGEVVEADIYVFHGGDNKLKVEACAAKGGYHTFYLDSLKELTDMFEDYEEPEGYWYIDSLGEVYMRTKDNQMSDIENTAISDWHLRIGNYFETKEEAEKAVERLRAWKRLKDKGFRFTGFTHKDRGRLDELEIYCQLGERPEDIEDMEDVRLLFGGEE